MTWKDVRGVYLSERDRFQKFKTHLFHKYFHCLPCARSWEHNRSIRQEEFTVPFHTRMTYQNVGVHEKKIWKVNTKLLTVSNSGEEKQQVFSVYLDEGGKERREWGEKRKQKEGGKERQSKRTT